MMHIKKCQRFYKRSLAGTGSTEDPRRVHTVTTQAETGSQENRRVPVRQLKAGEGEKEGDSMMRSTGSMGSASGGLYRRPGQAAGRPAAGKKGALLAVGAIVVIGFFVFPSFTGSGKNLRGSSLDSIDEGGPFAPDTWDILLISDLDKKSKVDDSGKEFKSVLQAGRLTRSPASSGDGSYSASWGTATDLVSGHNEAGRGMELSELITYRGSLMTVDDRTGIVFEIITDEAGRRMAPRYIIPEGDGNVDKGMKLEWATVKDNKLVVGSFGKEYTDENGAIVNTNNNWVNFIDEHGVITREDWTEQYDKLREATGALFPGYMIHESAAWSDALQKWVFLPRRISTESYDDVKDEKMGSNKILLADDEFRNVEVKEAGVIRPTHGFSSFKFVPGTGDKVIVALKSEESEEEDSQDTYLTVFTLDGEVLLDETEVPGSLKFEGIEILPVPLSEASSGPQRQRRKLYE